MQVSETEHVKLQNAFNKLQTDSKSWVNLPAWQKKNFFNWTWYKNKVELESYELQQKYKKEYGLISLSAIVRLYKNLVQGVEGLICGVAPFDF